MLKVVFSSRFFSTFNKIAAEGDWWEDYSYEEQKKYIQDHPDTDKRITKKPGQEKSRGFEMTREQIQDAIKQYQNPKSKSHRERVFARLYKNFTPMIMGTVRERIQHLNPSKDQRDDMVSKANMIFVKTIDGADADSPGIISYIKKTLSNQLLGESRNVMEGDVKKRRKDVLLQIAAKRFMMEHRIDPRQLTDEDYKHMARWINMHQDYDPMEPEHEVPTDEEIAKMPDDEAEFAKFHQNHPRGFRTRVNHATAEGIQSALSTRVESLDRPMGDDEDSRSLLDVLNPQQEDEEHEERLSQLRDMIEKLEPDEKKIVDLYLQGYRTKQIKEKMKELYGTDIHRKMIVRTLNRIKEQMGSQVRDDEDLEKESHLNDMLKIANELSRFVTIAYIPRNVTPADGSFIIDGTYRIKRYASQLVCDCGRAGCLHRGAIRKWIRQNGG